MKCISQLKRLAIIFVAASCVFIGDQAFARRSTELGNGGDAVLQEFNLRGIQIAGYLIANPAIAARYRIDGTKFMNVVKSTELLAMDSLFIGAAEVDAKNYPDTGEIEVSRNRWLASAAHADAFLRQRRIALHEYLWIYGIDDTLYSTSNLIMAELEKSIGRGLDPAMQKLVRDRLCLKVYTRDFDGARADLEWGLDVNEPCEMRHLSTSRGGNDPLFILVQLFKFKDLQPLSDTERTNALNFARSLFEYGANANAAATNPYESLLGQALEGDTALAQLFLEFGADPNISLRDGHTAFSALANWSPSRFTLATFKMFMDAGADPNKGEGVRNANGAARYVIQSEGNWDLVEELIRSNTVDWCSKPPWVYNSVLDSRRSEYTPLILRYNVRCP